MLPSPQMTVPLSLVTMLSWPPSTFEYEIVIEDGLLTYLKFIWSVKLFETIEPINIGDEPCSIQIPCPLFSTIVQFEIFAFELLETAIPAPFEAVLLNTTILEKTGSLPTTHIPPPQSLMGIILIE